MESPTTMQARIPDPATSKRLLANLRKTQLKMAEFNQELIEINEMLAEYNRQQWANRRLIGHSEMGRLKSDRATEV